MRKIMKNKAYLIVVAPTSTDNPKPRAVTPTKKASKRFLKELGFHYNKAQNLYLTNNPHNNNYYAKILPIQYYDGKENEND